MSPNNHSKMLGSFTNHCILNFCFVACQLKLTGLIAWLQNSKDVSIHDIMDEPWPIDQASEHVFEHFLAQAVKAGSLQPMTVHKVCNNCK